MFVIKFELDDNRDNSTQTVSSGYMERPYASVAEAKARISEITGRYVDDFGGPRNVRIVRANEAEAEFWYEASLETPNHVCVMQDTPDGHGCVICMYH